MLESVPGRLTRPPDDYLPGPQQELVALWHEPCWYAVYTRSRHEKCVADELLRKSVETLLPVYETVRQWKNGRHRATLPRLPPKMVDREHTQEPFADSSATPRGSGGLRRYVRAATME